MNDDEFLQIENSISASENPGFMFTVCLVNAVIQLLGEIKRTGSTFMMPETLKCKGDKEEALKYLDECSWIPFFLELSETRKEAEKKLEELSGLLEGWNNNAQTYKNQAIWKSVPKKFHNDVFSKFSEHSNRLHRSELPSSEKDKLSKRLVSLASLCNSEDLNKNEELNTFTNTLNCELLKTFILFLNDNHLYLTPLSFFTSIDSLKGILRKDISGTKVPQTTPFDKLRFLLSLVGYREPESKGTDSLPRKPDAAESCTEPSGPKTPQSSTKGAWAFIVTGLVMLGIIIWPK